jgi:hypothetical protein
MGPSAVPGRIMRARLFAAAGVLLLTSCEYVTTSPTTAVAPSQSTPSGSASGSTTLTYTTDVAPILATDCVRCHGPATQQAGIDLSTYAGVLRVVVPGSANSFLVIATEPSGLMYGQFSGNRSAKSTTVRNWVVSSNAAR